MTQSTIQLISEVMNFLVGKKDKCKTIIFVSMSSETVPKMSKFFRVMEASLDLLRYKF